VSAARKRKVVEWSSPVAMMAGNCVRPSTRAWYNALLSALRIWFTNQGMSMEDHSSLDLGLAGWMADQFLEGEPSYVGSRTLSAVKFAFPCYSRFGSMRLPVSTQVLAGWVRQVPLRSRLPLPMPVIAMICNQLLVEGLWSMAVAVVMCVIFYLRPSELFKIRTKDVAAPSASQSVALQCWAVVLHPSEETDQLGSKTGEVDESLLLDLPSLMWFGPVLQRLVGLRQNDAMLFEFSQTELAKSMKRICLALGLLDVQLYQLRHSGPSIDFAARSRTLAEIKRRGRWRSDASVRRYEKGGRLNDQMAKLSGAVRDHSLKCELALESLLLRTAVPLLFRLT
jgi:hypothetical protein